MEQKCYKLTEYQAELLRKIYLAGLPKGDLRKVFKKAKRLKRKQESKKGNV